MIDRQLPANRRHYHPLPTVRSRKKESILCKPCVYWSLLITCSVVLLYLIPLAVRKPATVIVPVGNLPSATPRNSGSSLQDEDSSAPLAAHTWQKPSLNDVHTLVAILPITQESLLHLPIILTDFLLPSATLHEILLVFPESMVFSLRGILRRVMSGTDIRDHPSFSLRPFTDGLDLNSAVMHVASEVDSRWLLVLDENGFRDIDVRTRDLLLNPYLSSAPVGPKGIIVSQDNVVCVIPSESPQAVSYLLPPFVLPSAFALDDFLEFSSSNFWASLGASISSSHLENAGGFVIGFDRPLRDWCFEPMSFTSRLTTDSEGQLQGSFPLGGGHETCGVNGSGSNPRLIDNGTGVFSIFLPSLADLKLLSPTACLLQASDYIVQVLLYQDRLDLAGFDERLCWEERNFDFKSCILKYSQPLRNKECREGIILDWINNYEPDVVITLSEERVIAESLQSALKSKGSISTLVRIPQSDLGFTEWMGSLTLQEWKNWNIPRIDVSIITNDRPYSLARLLASLSKSLFFGDTLNLRINMEQSSDEETLQLVEDFQWIHGSVFVHHRVIHGGLLPAVVESWYPHSNHTYGLLLEDDVELSPLFYAWIKMSILRYRYGHEANKSPRLFGISLYQQKNIELRREGRRPFNARTLFTDGGMPNPSTPYLSQIPCSWGAVYFPEHWREFVQWLMLRFSEYPIGITENVVPEVRSNGWTRSWKKYFIELVYLRGYVMLYPNYPDFVSLSTNHLEVGSHVKDRSDEKKDLFILPIMKLPNTTTTSSPGLLDIPGRSLPDWNILPIVNLTGFLTSMDELCLQGQIRREELGCARKLSVLYDVRDLMCANERFQTVL